VLVAVRKDLHMAARSSHLEFGKSPG
jgi:hypothetical protein